LPLADVVLADRWPDADVPPPPSRLRAPEPTAVVGARDEADRLLTPPGSLGLLDRAVDRAVALGCADLAGGVLVLAAADHPVAGRGVSAYPVSTTRDVVTAAVDGVALGAAAARAAGLDLVVVDAGVQGAPVPGAVGVRPAEARGDLVTGPAMTAADTERLLTAGRALGAEHGRGGLVALGEVGVGNTTVAAALACGLLHVEPDAVTGLGAGADAAMLERKRDVVGAALRRAGAGLDPQRALAELGGPELAVLAGVVLGAAEARAVVVVDGFAASVAALVAVLLEPAAQSSLVAGQRSRERGHDTVLQALGLEPLLDLRLRAGEGVGAVLAAGLLLQALAVRRDTARVDR
jgi:nicotinate-nucleotide--dimethylbenzimidazole phosphoribosyltransferase